MQGCRRRRGRWFDEMARNEGLRVTVPRQMVVDVLERARGHISADEIYFQVHKDNPGIGLTTVYRTLELLVRMGAVARFEFGDGCARYELSKGNDRHHHHLVCSQCGKVLDYTDFAREETELMDKMEKMLKKKYEFEIERHVLHFYGKCKECRKKEDH